jgi:hypothetical protein
VCYHEQERIGISRDDRDLIRECLRRGLSEKSYHLAVIEPQAHPPWEVEEIAPLQAKEEGESKHAQSAPTFPTVPPASA